MTESLQAKRRLERFQDTLATLAAAGVLALLSALLMTALLWLGGWLAGHPGWHSEWLDGQLAKGQAWLGELPGVGGAFAGMVNGLLPASGAARDWLVLAFLFFSPALVPAAHVGPVLVARYDDEALRPPPPQDLGLRWAGPLGATQQQAWQAVLQWCAQGMGSGRSPLWRPWAIPRMPEPFAVAVLTGPNGSGKTHLMEALSRALDGSDRLLACAGPAARTRLRLGVKLGELCWWRTRAADAPWDCGFLVEDPAARLRLQPFRPRRPTLIVADEMMSTSLRDSLVQLAAARIEFRHPVRLLVVDTALPEALGLRLDESRRQWRSALLENATVQVIDMSSVRFETAEFRALVGAQPETPGSGMAAPRLHLFGRDAAWRPLLRALDHEPVQMAEAIRFVRDEAQGNFAVLLSEVEGLSERLALRQEVRAPVDAPEDAFGVRRELLRERVIARRAARRQAAIREAIGAGTDIDLAWHALLVASLANGAASERLRQRLGSKLNPLTPERLRRIFGPGVPAGWVPPIKPTVIVDELLRLHFRAPRGTSLDAQQRQDVADALADAWLCHPGGTLRTVARWSGPMHDDDLAHAMRRLPDLHAVGRFPGPGGVGVPLVDVACAFFELAVLHDGDWQLAEQAMARVEASDWPAFEAATDALLSRPTAFGAPALRLWLRRVQRRTLAGPGTNDASAKAWVLDQAQRLKQLVRQDVAMASQHREALLPVIVKDWLDALPAVGRLMLRWADDTDFQAAMATWDETLTASSIIGNVLRDDVHALLAGSLMTSQRPVSGQPAQWLRRLGALLAAMDPANPLLPVFEPWSPEIDATDEQGPIETASAADMLWGEARQLAVIAWAATAAEPSACARAAGRVAHLVDRAPDHAGIALELAKGLRYLALTPAAPDPAVAMRRLAALAARHATHAPLQVQCARALRNFGRVREPHDPALAIDAVRQIALIAERQGGHVGVQLVHALALRDLALARQDTDAVAVADAAGAAAAIAERWPAEEGIQCAAAEAQRTLAWACKDTDGPRTRQAADEVARIAAQWPGHVFIQHECAVAWRFAAWSCKASDAAQVEHCAHQADAIARRWPNQAHIQHEVAQAFRIVAQAYENRDVGLTAEAACRVVTLARPWPEHAGLQHEHAQALCILAWARRRSGDPSGTERLAQAVRKVAERWPDDESIQLELARALLCVVWAHETRDAAQAETAAREVAGVAARWPRSVDMQHAATAAFSALVLIDEGHDVALSIRAVAVVADIARAWPGHERLQFECAQAWRGLAWAHRSLDHRQAWQSAREVLRLAAGFPQSDRIRLQAAMALRYSVESAAHFDDAGVVQTALDALTQLTQLSGMRMTVGDMSRQITPQGQGGVREELQLSLVAVQAWEAARGDDGARAAGASDGP